MAVNVNKAQSSAGVWPFPPDLEKSLPHPKRPWEYSNDAFNRVKNEPLDPTNQFRRCKIKPSDPECQFILKYFYQMKPPNHGIKNIYCIHNKGHLDSFLGAVKDVESEANNPFFSPQWDKEKDADLRKDGDKRWEKLTDQFSPLEIVDKRTDVIQKAKAIFLWHGCDENTAKSVASSGFTFFGKHHFFNPLASSGGSKSTDYGYFGSGIYFTDSAEYAAMYAKGRLIMAIVLMRRPFPVVSNVKHPNKCDDMKILEGQGAYQKYNAHFIPVASIRPNDQHCMEYYPCEKGQNPAWDEIVVFQKNHALARFEVELCDDSPGSMPALYSLDVCISECKKGNIDLVKQWITQDPSRLEEKDKEGETLFYHAFINEKFEILDWMKAVNKTAFQKFLTQSKKLMYLAAKEGKIEAMKWVYEKDKDILKKYRPPMMDLNGPLKTLGLTCFVSYRDYWDEETPLHAAIKGDHIEATKWLCSKEWSLATTKSINGKEPKELTKNPEILQAIKEAEDAIALQKKWEDARWASSIEEKKSSTEREYKQASPWSPPF